MNVVDLVLILLIITVMWRGYRRGFIEGMIELAGWLGTLLVVFLVYPPLAELLQRYVQGSLMALALFFMLCIFLVRLVIGALMNLVIDKIPLHAHRHEIDHLLGIIPGGINGMVYAALISGLMIMIPVSRTLTAKTADSLTAQLLEKFLVSAKTSVESGFTERIQRLIAKPATETGSDKFIKLDFKMSVASPRPDLETEMLELVNGERAKAGLHALAAEPELRDVARRHSADMFDRGYFSHYSPEKVTPFDRIKAGGVRYLTAGENLALAPNLDQAHNGLMKSPGHRANILNPGFGHVGIGILDGGMYGLMVTQNFTN